MSTQPNWDDLSARTLSGIVIAAVALVAVIAGGVWFQMLAVFAAAVMIWELWMMIRPDLPERGMMMAALAAAALSGVVVSEDVEMLLLFALTPLIGAGAAGRERPVYIAFAIGIQLAALWLIVLRADGGIAVVLWLISVVVGTDMAGYFAGKRFGGPKFWPRLSPKKTWSGIVAGWIVAAIIGGIYALSQSEPWVFVPLSVLLSLASQLGDITESALKRRMGVKDSSALIPGHGGLLDRFDGLMGASVVLFAISAIGVSVFWTSGL